MPFSKSEMQEELLQFLSLFGSEITRLYGASNYDWTSREAIQTSPVWEAVTEMYDYGVTGIPKGDLVPGARINGIHAHAEMFLHAMDTPAMKIYLEESDNTTPRLAMLAVQSAVARMVLDGGDRYSDFGAVEYGIRVGDYGYLTISDVALLANMDERSVRNAANPKLPDPLKTEQRGKRSLVSPEEACRWLSGRKGFIPTAVHEGPAPQRPPEFDIELTEEMVAHIEREAKKAGLSFNAYFKKALFNAMKEEMKK